MTLGSSDDAEDRIVVGFFADGANAYRAITELIDEGFQATEVGAAFRTPRVGMAVAEGGKGRGVSSNPAVSGSVGGAASRDEAVTPAGLAPGSGNAFPAASRPGPIPGGEVPASLPHDLLQELPSTLPREPESSRGSVVAEQADRSGSNESRRERLGQMLGSGAASSGSRRGMKFGTVEGHLFPDYEYSETSFENSFLGMGLGVREARNLSGRFSQGGALVCVTPGSRASLAEGIIERNHGEIRFEKLSGRAESGEGSRVEIYGRMRNYYRPEESIRRKAS